MNSEHRRVQDERYLDRIADQVIALATASYANMGPGAVIIDLRDSTKQSNEAVASYVTADRFGDDLPIGWDDLVADHNPSLECIVILLRSSGIYAYRLVTVAMTA